jgi:hypothetical protein
MGRGRQKAKQTKVARELKYHTSSIDVTALEQELSGGRGDTFDPRRSDQADDSDDDRYAAYADRDDDDLSDYASPSRGR